PPMSVPLWIRWVGIGRVEPSVQSLPHLGSQRLWRWRLHQGAVGTEDADLAVFPELLPPARPVDLVVVEAAPGPEVPLLGGPSVGIGCSTAGAWRSASK